MKIKTQLFLTLILFAFCFHSTLEPAHAQTEFDCTAVAEIPITECEALTALYNSTKGEDWYHNTSVYYAYLPTGVYPLPIPPYYTSNWLNTETPCSWDGITCTNGSVSEVKLGDIQILCLRGAIPPEISNLPNLTVLTLRAIPDYRTNDLCNTNLIVSAEIGNLSNLTHLTLRRSVLPLDTLRSIGNLSNLATLDLSQNDLTTPPPGIGNLSNLTTLNLSQNDLTTVPPEIGNLSSLNTLNLRDNELTTVPPEIGNLSSLTTLYLFGNSLTTVPSEIGNLSNLTSLYLFGNSLTTVPPEIGNLSNLTTLDLYNNPLQSWPSTITNLTNLQSLNIRGATCVPADPAIQAWLDNIESVSGRSVGTASCSVVNVPMSNDGSLTTISQQIELSSGLDAVEERADGTMYMDSSDLEIGRDAGANQLIGLRYQNVNIPPNATITDATLMFTVDEAQSAAAEATFYGESVGNTEPFSNTVHNISSRERTATSVTWNDIPTWDESDIGSHVDSPSLIPILQEIVDHSEWAAGNSLVIIVEGNGRRAVASFNGDEANAPVLQIEYTTAEQTDALLSVHLQSTTFAQRNRQGVLALFVVVMITVLVWFETAE